MRQFLFSIKQCLLLVGSASLVLSCQDYEPFSEDTVKNVAYGHEFEKVFGTIDPEQTWNLASRATVTVNVDKESEIKVYAINHGHMSIVADYSNVTGTRTLGFDVVEGTTDIMVTDGATAQYAKVGDEVDFTGTLTRTMYNTDTDIVSVGDYREFSQGVTTAFPNVIPKDQQHNYQNVTCNFYWVSKGPFTFYPLYWRSSYQDMLGIYWVDANGDYHEMDVYMDKCGDEVQIPTGSGGWRYAGNEADELPYYREGDVAFRSRGITINLPPGQVFGMYIKVYDPMDNKQVGDPSNPMFEFKGDINDYDWKVFSEESKNAHMLKENGGEDWSYSDPEAAFKDRAIHAATFQATDPETGKVYTYFSFENGSYCPSLDDLVFVFGDEVPTVVDEDAGQEWILAYEDLGNSFDWDFNDVVLSVGHVSGLTTARITPLAAGGTLASNIYFGGNDLGEIHQLFGQGETTSGDYTPVNHTERGNIGKYLDVNVSEDFSMTALSDHDSGSSDDVSDHRGIVIKVTPAGGDEQMAAEIVYSLENKGKAPEVFCIPRSWETREPTEEGGTTTRYWREWRWPKEVANIDKAYSRFAAWAKDRTDNDWYKDDPVLDKCVTGTFDFTTTSTTELGNGTSYASNSAIHIVSKNVKLVAGQTYNLEAFFTTESTGKIHYILTDNEAGCSLQNGLWTGSSVGKTCQLKILQESDANNDQCTGVIDIEIIANDMASDFYGGTVSGATVLTITSPATMTYTDNSGHVSTFDKTTFVDCSDVTGSAGATAELYIEFNSAPNTSFYLDYADASQLYEDFRSFDKTAVKYSLNADQLANLLSKTNADGKKGIYIVGFNDAEVKVKSAQLLIK